MSTDIPKDISVTIPFPHSERILKAAEKYDFPIEQVVFAALSQVDWDDVCQLETELQKEYRFTPDEQ